LASSQQQQQHNLQKYEKNIIIKAPTSTTKWLKHAITLEFDKTLQQYNLFFVFA
jgi:hypothetical protein